MKSNLLTISILFYACSLVYGQEQKPIIDASRKVASSSPSFPMKATFLGKINTPTADLKWKPNLTRKITYSEPLEPNEALIEKIKEEKNLLKQHAADKGVNSPLVATASNPVIGTNFQGNPNNGSSPLDNNIAISRGGWIVSVTNDMIEYYDMSGNNYYNNDLLTFLNNTSITGVCDPVVFYDAGSDRFVFYCQDSPLYASDHIYVAFSVSNNPTAGWYIYTLTGDPLAVGDGFDYPKIAVSNNELFISGNLFSEPSGTYDQSVVYQIDKTQGYTGASVNWVYWSGISGSPFTLLPVSYGQNSTYGPGIYLVSTNSAGGSTINLYDITNDQYHTPTMNSYTVSTTAYSVAGDATQPSTSCQLKTNDCRALSGFYLNGVIQFVFNCDIGSGWCGINYNRLDVATTTNVSKTTGFLGTDDYCYPSVVSFATASTDASVVIGFGYCGPATYPGIGVISCDNSMSWSPNAIIVSPGSSYVSYTSTTLERWGDYSGTTRNHASSSPQVWMNGAYGTNSNNWSTWIAQINGVTGINEINNNVNNLNVYPNPIVKTFSVDFSLKSDMDLNISVIDINGKIVKELYTGKGKQGDNVFSFNSANLSDGIYFLTINSNNDIIKNEKIVVSK